MNCKFSRITKIFGLAAILALAISACGPINKQLRPSASKLDYIKRVGIIINKEPEVTVICDRSKATATPAVMFGLIGAAVASAYNDSLDQAKTDKIDDSVNQVSLRSTFSNSLLSTLRDSNRFEDIQLLDVATSYKTQRSYDAIITITIENWGLRLIDKENDKMATFIEVTIFMVSSINDQVIWDEHHEIIGHKREHFTTYENNNNLFIEELSETVEELGYKIASILIY